MRALPPPLRKHLETSVLAARRAAESASRAVLEGLGVFQREKPAHLDADQARLRVGLRQKWRQLGGDEAAKPLLVGECTYEQWHRLLFARFLAENDLLLHPQYNSPVTLADCDELAAEFGEPDGWSVAARFAAEILPGIFRLDDPCVRLRLAPEGRHALEQILNGLPLDVFRADDALGWVYQFWQKDKKDEVNASERKIGGADIGPVTQLFTENYMVRFLLENSLGAWWAARQPESPLVKEYDYLRFDDDGTPAAGTFDGWPDRVAEVTVMDPCCGSGHFLVEAFSMLWRMRTEEEGLSPVEAQDAVLRDNLFGLEIDPRCVQIAMFAVALQAWKAGGGWRQLPVPNIACSGVSVKAPVDEWKVLAGGDQRIENALVRLHILFRDADTLGSLIDPKRSTEVTEPAERQITIDDVEWSDVTPLLEAAASRETTDPAAGVLGREAASIAKAAALLSARYVLVATNVPYLQRRKHGETLRRYASAYLPDAKSDLATLCVVRALTMVSTSSSVALVSPQNWLYLKSFESLRRRWLAEVQWDVIAVLGLDAFGSIASGFVDVFLGLWTNRVPTDHSITTIDVSSDRFIESKRLGLLNQPVRAVQQRRQLQNPLARLQTRGEIADKYLSDYARSCAGIQTGDTPKYVRQFWELSAITPGWEPIVTAPNSKRPYTGRDQCLWWEDGAGAMVAEPSCYVRGREAWGRNGVSMAQMGALNATLYRGELFDQAAPAIIPASPEDLGAIWAFLSSSTYEAVLRNHYAKSVVTPAAYVQVPFDVEYWRQVALDAGPLPEPWSNDPTQWLFAGRPEVSTAPLQVAVARLVGYRWPDRAEADDLDAFVDPDGIVCLPSVAGEPPAADRIQQVLAAAFGDAWSPAKVKELLEQTGTKKRSLAEWLRDEFFKQHCALFANRPFVWHIWDGQHDGFAALVNYHRLDRKKLEKLTYTYLGQDWVERQRAEVRDEVAGAEARLSAALELGRKLELILEGESPFDIYVRWKELHEQPVGWEPDLNDGVRLNIRPFVDAGVLRSPFNIHWKKDRGKNADGTERQNDKHLTHAEKLNARRRAGRA